MFLVKVEGVGSVFAGILRLVRRFYNSDPLNPNSLVRTALRWLDRHDSLDAFVAYVATCFPRGLSWLEAVIAGLGY